MIDVAYTNKENDIFIVFLIYLNDLFITQKFKAKFEY